MNYQNQDGLFDERDNARQHVFYVLIVLVVLWNVALMMWHAVRARKLGQQRIDTQALDEYVGDRLDGATDNSGVYVRTNEAELPTDSWGTRLNVVYSQGALREIVQVRSAGPARVFGTKDDQRTERHSVSAKGLRNTVEEDVEEVGFKGTRGVVRGGIQGIREGLKDIRDE